MRAGLIIAGLALALAIVDVGLGDTTPVLRDSTGDARGAPDIVSIFLGGWDDYLYVVAGLPTSARTGRSVVLEIDSDRNPRTGNADGFEYRFTYDLATSVSRFEKWNGTRFVSRRAPGNLAVDFSGSCCDVAFTVVKASIGGAGSFDFRVTTLRKGGGRDAAPNRGRWTYPAAIDSDALLFTNPIQGNFPDLFKAGKPFKVTAGIGSKAGTPTVTCRGYVRAQPVALKASYSGGMAICAGIAPRGSAGKVITGTITATAGSESESVSFVFEIR
jgi:hypothetical protein